MGELRGPPSTKNGTEVHMRILQNDYAPTTTYNERELRPDPRARLCWTHVSIFWELPYWEKCSVRHALDVMHIEKNVCDNIFGTVLGVQGKTKDDFKARMSLKDMNIRQHLWPTQDRRGKIFLPQAPYTVDPTLRSTVFDRMSSVKYPSGYAGSLRNKIREDDNKFLGLKTHDCHIIMQRLLPVVIRPYVDDSVADALVELCDFFRMLCAREVRKDEVRLLKDNIVIILCKLEMIFPPAFFTIMVHLCIHLPDQVLLTGPVHYTWMFSTERQLGVYKRDIKNKRFPEACIAERHLIHECVNFINRYLHDDSIQEEVPLPNSQWNISVVTSVVKASGVVNTASLTPKLKRAAHWCVLQHCKEAERFITEYRQSIELYYPDQAGNTEGIITGFINHFLKMLRDTQVTEGVRIPRELLSIAKKVQSVNFFSQCVVNGVKFTCQGREENRCTQNSGVSVDADGELFFGVLELVVELLYENRMPVYLFWCKWFDTSPDNVKYDRGLTSINCNNTWYADNPFIMAVNATQVFYIDDPANDPGWKVVNHVAQRNTYPEATIASTKTRDPKYAVDQPYQEDLSFVIPISAISLDLRHVPHVYIPVDENETSDADPDYVVNEDEESDNSFNNDELSGSDVDIDTDVDIDSDV